MRHDSRFGILIVFAASVLIAGCFSLRPDPDPPAKPGFQSYTGEPEFTAEAGATVTSTFRWATRVLLDPQNPPGTRRGNPPEPNFVWCVVGAGRSDPSRSDVCYAFDAVQCTVLATSSLKFTRSCTGDVTLPTTLAGTQGLWYVRAEEPSNRKIYTDSNVLAFAWNVPLPDLALEEADIKLYGTSLQVSANVINPTAVDVTNGVVRILVTRTASGSTVTLYDSNQNVALVPGGTVADPGKAAVGVLIPSSEFDTVPRPFDINVVFTVDPGNAIAETDETNNVDQDTQTIY